ncbi:MAG: VPLPA-CTERM sorting domain-containing protein [Gammaproteobacteria bacterium]|nr:VPLPA-CTERM sorting domain-containing protein [Gammaproteobacteria bacterium]
MKNTTRKTSRKPLLALVLLMAMAATADASLVTVNFTANVTSAQNSFAGAGPTVSGSFTFDTVQGTDFNGTSNLGVYQFSGSPYGFSVTVNNFGTLSGTNTLVQIGDDGAALPGFDTVQFAGNQGNIQASLDWSGPTSSFSGDDITTVSVIQGMNPFFVIREFGQIDLQATITSTSFDTSAVPVPAAVWLFCSGLLGLIAISRRKKAA